MRYNYKSGIKFSREKYKEGTLAWAGAFSRPLDSRCPVAEQQTALCAKATGNSRSGILGNRGPPKFPAGIPGNF